MNKACMRKGSDIHKIIELFLRSGRTCNANDCILLKNIEKTIKKLRWKYLESETMYTYLDVHGKIDAVFKRGGQTMLVDWKVTRRNIHTKCLNIDEKFDAFYKNYVALYILQINLYNFIYNQENTELYIGNIVGDKVNIIKCQKFSRQFMERVIYNYSRLHS